MSTEVRTGEEEEEEEQEEEQQQQEQEEQEQQQYRVFVSLHAEALRSSGLPRLYWRSLFNKISREIYDAGEVFGIMEEEGEEEEEQEGGGGCSGSSRCRVVVVREDGLQTSDSTSVFLVDHAWTYRVEQARQQLEQIPGLLPRMAALVGVEVQGEAPDQDRVELVMERLWKYSQTYQLSRGSAEDKVPVWYVMDEFGSRVQHSDRPSCAVAPFFSLQTQVAYSLMWPLQDLQPGEEVTRDYAYGETDTLLRRCRLLPWKPDDLDGVSSRTAEPPDGYYEEILRTNGELLPVGRPWSPAPQGKVLKVYSVMSQVQNHLTHPGFQLTEDEDEADIIWAFQHFKDYHTLSVQRPHVMINQFPCESLVTVKDCLAAVARRVKGGPLPDWLPETFNLRTELPQFVKHYLARRRRGDDNHWICKPWNLARGLDTHISSNLDFIIRQREGSPKVVCKYLEDPVLFRRDQVGLVKFDIRYMLMLRSVQPLRLYAYNVFWLRFANRPFSLDQFDDYQKHFTVMNYADEVELKQVHYDDFIPMFEEQYPQYPWREVEAHLFQAFKELFQAASCRPAPYGLAASPSSRAIYAADVMLKWSAGQNGEPVMQPQILELNFCPDCSRACLYHPSFYNHMFQTLFLDQAQDCPVTQIV